ncbi:N-acetylneuraminate epimerase, partial [Escherichia coli]|nr:N-acetylneuraminate epimerase [Escherichia coli]
AIDKINAHYFDKKAEDYFFNKFLLSFDPSTQQWIFTCRLGKVRTSS